MVSWGVMHAGLPELLASPPFLAFPEIAAGLCSSPGRGGPQRSEGRDVSVYSRDSAVTSVYKTHPLPYVWASLTVRGGGTGPGRKCPTSVSSGHVVL